MLDIIKGLWKWIVWILVILLLGIIILLFRIFVIDKDYDGTAKSISKKNKNGTTSVTEKTDGQESTNQEHDGNSKEEMKDSLKENDENKNETIGEAVSNGYKKDSEYDYNPYEADLRFLMYEGEQKEGAIKSVLDLLISNTKENFYDRTSVTAVGFGENQTIVYEGDLEEYRNKIQKMKSAVGEGTYDVSFHYGGLGAYINEIVITKK